MMYLNLAHRPSDCAEHLRAFFKKPMITKAFLPTALALLAGFAALSPALGAELTAVRLSATPEAAQLALDLTGPAAERIFTLRSPDRAVIDLAGTQPGETLRVPSASGVVTGVRLGRQPGGALRVVLELRARLPLTSAWAEPVAGAGRQLVITLGEPSASVESAPRTVLPTHAPAAQRDIIVAVDAGHGGQDPGAIGHGGTREKDVTLAIARRLAERIDREPGMRAVLTRDSDEFLSLRERINGARAARADMFISVHADSAASQDVSGCSVYVLSERGASSEAARWLAERENGADLIGGVKLDDKDSTLASVLLDLSQSASLSASMTAAERVLASLDGVQQVRKSQVQQAGFVVLKSPDIPSMLIETAYISNPVEERKLRSLTEQQRLAEAIFAGVRAYFKANPPDGTKLASEQHNTVARTGEP
jgi:N-acetylmuramoyl-L-alanine amidase